MLKRHIWNILLCKNCTVVQSVTRSCLTLWDPLDCSTPGFPVRDQLLELAETQVRQVGDTIKPFHSLYSPSPLAFNLFQHQSLFQWVSSSHQVAKLLELQLQHQSFQWIFRVYFFYDWLVWSLWSPSDSRESSPTAQFKSINSLVFSLLYGPLQPSLQFSHPYMTTGKTIALTIWTTVGKVMSLLFNMLSRLIIAFLGCDHGSSHHLQWIWSPPK